MYIFVSVYDLYQSRILVISIDIYEELAKDKRGMKTNHTSVKPNWPSEPYGTKFEPFNSRFKAFGKYTK